MAGLAGTCSVLCCAGAVARPLPSEGVGHWQQPCACSIVALLIAHRARDGTVALCAGRVRQLRHAERAERHNRLAARHAGGRHPAVPAHPARHAARQAHCAAHQRQGVTRRGRGGVLSTGRWAAGVVSRARRRRGCGTRVTRRRRGQAQRQPNGGGRKARCKYMHAG